MAFAATEKQKKLHIKVFFGYTINHPYFFLNYKLKKNFLRLDVLFLQNNLELSLFAAYPNRFLLGKRL